MGAHITDPATDIKKRGLQTVFVYRPIEAIQNISLDRSKIRHGSFFNSKAQKAEPASGSACAKCLPIPLVASKPSMAMKLPFLLYQSFFLCDGV